MAMKLSVVICTKDRGAIFEETMRAALEACRGLDAEVLVVNDSKTARPSLPSGEPRVRLLDNPKSGAASARNLGARHASGELLLFVDDDVRVAEASLRRTLELHARNPRSAFNLNWRYPDDLLAQLDATPFGRFLRREGLIDYRGWVRDIPWRDAEVFEVPKLAAFYLSIEKREFDAAGGFDESFANQGVEDDELCQRLRARGIRLFVDPGEFVLHDERDKLRLESRLARMKTGAANKRHAFEMGMKEYELRFPPHKAAAYTLLLPLQGLLRAAAGALPNARWCDPLYGRLAHVLVGVAIFEGYGAATASKRRPYSSAKKSRE
jgi:GT2 family glycosyltransferase